MRPIITLILLSTILYHHEADAQSVPPYVPANNLSAWYSFSGNMLDSSGNINHATAGSASLTADRFGNINSAYSFNGVSDYMQINTTASSSLDIRNGSFTIAAWFRTNWKSMGNDQQIFWRGDAQYATDAYCLYISNGSLVFRRDVGFGLSLNTVSYPIPGNDTNLWHHIAGTYDSATDVMVIYLDGLPVFGDVKPGKVNYSTSSYYNNIGSVDNGGTQHFKGEIDDLGVWQRALSVCEIRKLFIANNSIISSQPAGSVVATGDSAKFSIVQGGGPATYRWQVDTGSGFSDLIARTPYSGVNGPVLTVYPASMAENGLTYRCIVLSTCTDTSANAVLTVLPAPSNIVSVERPLFNIFPNPSDGTFTVRSSSPSPKMLIEIADMTGKIICRDSYHTMRTDLKLNYKGRLEPGTYILRVTAGPDQQSFILTRTGSE